MNRIVVIGGGNVAASLVPALGDRVVQVYSRTLAHAEELAPGRATDSLDSVTADADVYIITLVDDAVAPTAQRLARLNPGALWVHTSGSVPIEALEPLGPRRGVVYPLQTFSRGRRRDFADIPIFIEGDDPAVGLLARSLSRRVLEADSARRRRLHIAAVFGCNFVNHLWAIADDILRRETGTDISVLGPLLRETLRKALQVRPADAQTGPARRGDRGVIARHQQLLSPDEADLYGILSDHILKYYNNQHPTQK